MFEVADTDDMGIKRGTASGSFVAETQTQMLAFYGDVVQHVQKWAPKAPKLSESVGTEDALAVHVHPTHSPALHEASEIDAGPDRRPSDVAPGLVGRREAKGNDNG